MRNTKRQLVAATVCITLLTCIAPRLAAPAPPPVEAFGRIPQVTAVELSPNGELVAWADNSGSTQKVVIYDLQQRKALRMLEIDPDMKLRGIDWSDDETLLFVVSLTQVVGAQPAERYEMFRTLAADVGGGPTRMLLMSGRNQKVVTGSVLLAHRTSKPKTVTMWTLDFSDPLRRPEIGSRLPAGRADDAWVASVFEVDTRTGEGRLIEQGTPNTNDWVADVSGQPIVRSEWDPERRSYDVLAKVEGKWRHIHSQVDQGQLTIYALTADGAAVLAIGAMGQSREKLWSIPFDGSGAKVLAEDPERDVVAVNIDGYTGHPVAVVFGGPDSDRRWLDAKAEARHRSLARAFPSRQVSAFVRSEDGQRVIARVAGPFAPPIYYLVDFRTGTADIIGEEYPDLAGTSLGEVRTISYKARDSVTIPAFVTIPPGLKPENLPLVVLPHGGPEARDYFTFDWQAQFLATRGYAVLQPQFRGSTGFGEEHRKAGYRQWGGVMQNDVTDGVKALIEQGLANPHRVCIVGVSYGGYAALAGAAFTPELYACAASVNGISDLPGLIGQIEHRSGEGSDSLAYWRDHIGSPFDANVIGRSPARAANVIHTPILLMHGVDDTVVPISQSETMARALKQFDRPYAFIKLQGEDHWLSRSETRIRVLKELETFLAAHL